MPSPATQVTIVGIYPLPYSEELLRAFVREVKGANAETTDKPAFDAECDKWREEMRQATEGLHLIELQVNAGAASLSIGDISQDKPNTRNSQAPYDERWLDATGTMELKHDISQHAGPARVAFWLHFVELDKGLHGPWGHASFPGPSPMPERLSRIITYSLP